MMSGKNLWQLYTQITGNPKLVQFLQSKTLTRVLDTTSQTTSVVPHVVSTI